MADDDPESVEALIHTALYDSSGEMVEGAFVDRWEPAAAQAQDALLAIFEERGFSDADRAAIEAVIRRPDARQEAVVRLVTALLPYTRLLVLEMLQDPLPLARAIALRVSARFSDGADLVAALHDPSPITRVTAVRALAQKRATIAHADDHLVEALADESARVRRAAAEVVRFYRFAPGGEALLRCFATENDRRVRDAIVTNLAQTTRREGVHVSSEKLEEGIGAGVKGLLLAQLNHEQASMREMVVRASERLRGVEVASALFEHLLIEPDEHVRLIQLLYMGFAVIAERALPLFAELLATSTNSLLRSRVAWLLEPFGAPAVPLLISALDDRGEPQRAAAMTLRNMGDRRALPALSRQLANPENSRYRNEIILTIEALLFDTYPPPPPPPLAGYIQAEIDALQAPTFGDWPVRVCKEELNALPMHSTILFLWALRPDGVLLCMDHEAFGHPTEAENDALTTFAAMVNGARRHPPLAAMIPAPPKATKVCLACNAQGYTTGNKGGTEGCGHCAGLGWREGK